MSQGLQGQPLDVQAGARSHRDKTFHLRLSTSSGASGVPDSTGRSRCNLPPQFPRGPCMIRVYSANCHFQKEDSDLGSFEIKTNIGIEGNDIKGGTEQSAGPFRTLCTLDAEVDSDQGVVGIPGAPVVTPIVEHFPYVHPDTTHKNYDLQRLKLSGNERVYRCHNLPSSITLELTGESYGVGTLGYVAQDRTFLLNWVINVCLQIEFD